MYLEGLYIHHLLPLLEAILFAVFEVSGRVKLMCKLSGIESGRIVEIKRIYS